MPVDVPLFRFRVGRWWGGSLMSVGSVNRVVIAANWASLAGAGGCPYPVSEPVRLWGVCCLGSSELAGSGLHEAGFTKPPDLGAFLSLGPGCF